MKIAVIGSGYVGTVTGACLAELNHHVTCADVNEERMKKLQQGIVPFYEEGLEAMIRTNLDDGRLSFSTDIAASVRDAEVVFICVSTPPLPDGKPDLKSLTKAVKTIASQTTSYKLIVEKSTMPIKTGTWLYNLMQSEMPKKTPFDIAAVPHFLREGHAVRDFMNPDRVIIGAESQKALDILVDIFRPLNAPMLITDINSAELIKHATNAFLATKISFINSIAHICEKTGADINVVAKGLGLDRRIGQEYLNAGIGYGGIFFPKDINSLVNIADEYHINLDLLKTTETINRYQRLKFIEKIEQALGSNGSASPEGQTLEGKTLAIWGLAYRPNTDDMRNAPSINIIRSLQQRGAKIRAYDPLTMGVAKASLPGVTFCEDAYDAAKGTDLIAILTEWDEFQTLNFQKLKETSQCRTIVDGRNLFNPVRMGTLGFRYISMGRPEGKPAGSIKVKAAALS